jgi:hypothetical protein
MVDARSPPPGVAAERAELWLEGNSHSPLRVVCEEVDRTALGAPNVAETGTEALSGSSLARGAPSVAPRPRMPGVPLSIGVRIL